MVKLLENKFINNGFKYYQNGVSAEYTSPSVTAVPEVKVLRLYIDRLKEAASAAYEILELYKNGSAHGASFVKINGGLQALIDKLHQYLSNTNCRRPLPITPNSRPDYQKLSPEEILALSEMDGIQIVPPDFSDTAKSPSTLENVLPH